MFGFCSERKPFRGHRRPYLCRYESVMIAGDEIVRVEELEIERFVALGLGRYDAIRAVEDGIDWRAVEELVQTGCALGVALEISR